MVSEARVGVIRLLAGPSGRLALLGLLLAAIIIGALAMHIPGADTVGSRPVPTSSSACSRSALVVYLGRRPARAAGPPAAAGALDRPRRRRR